MTTLKSQIECPKWAQFPRALREMVFNYDVKLDLLEIDKGWLTETVRFKVSGNEDQMLRFQIVLNQSIKEYNNR